MDYYPFGAVAKVWNNPDQAQQEKYRHGYQGEYSEMDTTTGWNSFQLRMYDPLIGRWLQVDPERQFASPYNGMGNNPISGVDPDGALVSFIDLSFMDTPRWHDMMFDMGLYTAVLPNVIISAGLTDREASYRRAVGRNARAQEAFMDHPVTQGVVFGLGFLTGGSEAILLSRLGNGLKVVKGPVRIAYEKTVKELAKVGDDMLANGFTKEATAETLHYLRRSTGVLFKDQTPVLQRGLIYARNLLKYGDRLGPSYHRLRRFNTPDQIIKSASKPGGKDLFK